MTLSGDLKVVASSDLKGLGAREGPPVVYNWTMPSLMPVLLPWLAVLGLLAFKFNRRSAAWWILLPLALGAGLGPSLNALGSELPMPNAALEVYAQLATAAAFGLAAIWLLAPVLAGKPWPLVFLGMLVMQTLMSLLTLLAGSDLESFPETGGLLMVLGIFDFGIVLALALAGLVCRRRYGAWRLLRWVVVFLVGGWMLAAVPFCLLAAFSGSFIPWYAIPMGAGLISVSSVLVLLPFLVLAFVNAFHRERLRALLGASDRSPTPPPLAPLTPTPQPA